MTAVFLHLFFPFTGKKKEARASHVAAENSCTEREEAGGETRPSVALAAVSLEASLTAHHYPAFSLPLPDHSGEIMLSFFSPPFLFLFSHPGGFIPH